MDPSHDLVPGVPGTEQNSGAGRDEAAREAPDGAGGMTERDVRILDFERQWWRNAGSKEQAIRERFGFSPTRYYQLLNALLEAPSAMAYDATLVKRLRRLRASRSRARSLRRLGES